MFFFIDSLQISVWHGFALISWRVFGPSFLCHHRHWYEISQITHASLSESYLGHKCFRLFTILNSKFVSTCNFNRSVINLSDHHLKSWAKQNKIVEWLQSSFVQKNNYWYISCDPSLLNNWRDHKVTKNTCYDSSITVLTYICR